MLLLLIACTAKTPLDSHPLDSPSDSEAVDWSQAVGGEVRTLATDIQAMDDLVVAPDGSLRISDFRGQGRQGNPLGDSIVRVSPEGEVEVLATGLPLPLGLELDAEGGLLVATWGDRAVWRVDADGQAEQLFVGDDNPSDVAVGPDGSVYVNAFNLGRIDRIPPGGARAPWSTEASFNGPHSLVFTEQGVAYVGNYYDGKLYRLDEDGAATQIAQLPDAPTLNYLAWLDGNLFATSTTTEQVFRITPEGEVSVFAGSGEQGGADGPALEARFQQLNGITADPANHRLLLVEGVQRLRELPLSPAP